MIVFVNSRCSSVSEFTHLFSITLYIQLMKGIVDEGVGWVSDMVYKSRLSRKQRLNLLQLFTVYSKETYC